MQKTERSQLLLFRFLNKNHFLERHYLFGEYSLSLISKVLFLVPVLFWQKIDIWVERLAIKMVYIFLNDLELCNRTIFLSKKSCLDIKSVLQIAYAKYGYIQVRMEKNKMLMSTILGVNNVHYTSKQNHNHRGESLGGFRSMVLPNSLLRWRSQTAIHSLQKIYIANIRLQYLFLKHDRLALAPLVSGYQI